MNDRLKFSDLEISRLVELLDEKESREKKLWAQMERYKKENKAIRKMFNVDGYLDSELINSPLYQKLRNPGPKVVTPQDLKDFVILMDQLYPVFYMKLLQIWPGLNSEEKLICYFSKARILPKDIAIILHKSPSYVSNIRIRLIKKMNKGIKSGRCFDDVINSLL